MPLRHTVRALGAALLLCTALAACGFVPPTSEASMYCASVRGANNSNGYGPDTAQCLAAHL